MTLTREDLQPGPWAPTPPERVSDLVAERDELLHALETLTMVWREAFPYIDQSPSFQNALAAIRKAKGQ